MSTYVPIQAITLSAAATTVEFTGIPQNFTDLIIVANVYTRFGSETAAGFYLRFNNDSSSLYSDTTLTGTGVSPSSSRSTGANRTFLGSIMAKTGTTSSVFPPVICHIMNYSNTTTNKTVISRFNSEDGTNNTSRRVGAGVGLWRSTQAITSIQISTDATEYVTGSTFTLYGIGSGAPKAFGGDEVRTDGTYWYHIFRSSGRFEPVQALTCDYLVVAGGGGGSDGAAGGAGGLRSTVTATGGGGSLESALSVSANTAYTVTVGAGGPAGTTTTNGTKGSNSIFSTITSNGGGAGKEFLSTGTTNQDGGSGAGGVNSAGAGQYINGGTGTTNQGFAGGRGYRTNSSYNGAGGGGGAGAAGSDGAGTGTSPIGGNGGAGVAVSITGSSVTYAGGGGGGSEGGTAGTGGSGGGGNGSATTTGSSGTANTGGGGGGGYINISNGGNGGSGIVVIRYSAV